MYFDMKGILQKKTFKKGKQTIPLKKTQRKPKILYSHGKQKQQNCTMGKKNDNVT